MKIGFYSESPADQAALAIITEGILGQPPEPISSNLRASGVDDVLASLDGVIRGIHFHSDAEALVVVVDSDDSPLHELNHVEPTAAAEGCRYCEVRRRIAHALHRLKPRPGILPLKVAVGLAVPAIEAWYLVGDNPGVGEPAWRAGLASGCRPFTRSQLKKLVYRTDRPTREHLLNRAEEEARRIVRDLQSIQTAFPIGFGLMAQEIRSWVAQ